MPKFFGKFGKSAVRTMKDTINRASKKGDLPHVNRLEKQQLFTAVEKVFTKNGKEMASIDKRAAQKEIFNRFRNSRKDRLDPGEVGEIEKVLGFDKIYTKQIGSKYPEIIRAEKRLEAKNRAQKAAENKTQKAAEFEKTQKPSRLETVLKKAKEPKTSPDSSNNKIFSEVSNQGSPGKKSPESGKIAKNAEVKETSGFKTQLKSGGKFRVSVSAPVMPSYKYDFQGKSSEFDLPQNLEQKTVYDMLKFKTPNKPVEQEASTNKEIPDWKMAAYADDAPESSEHPNLAEPAGPQNGDIDE